KNVPTRIVERTLEGNYRVKGSQPIMIGNREYKVIVTGIVRAEDFNEEGIGAGKLLDPKFDIVSARRKEGEM
ncbi:MAG TPA: flagellar basal body L-ring protein FlgH, partial [Bdellovibrionales bacterium]|nr:flagellar basal body L-ring protein FlgH [Bdellovibrionales bacterium]